MREHGEVTVMNMVQGPTESVRNLPLHWHFRAMPSDIQRGAIRRLALSGLADSDIAARIGWPVERVRQTIAEDECIQRLIAPVRTNYARFDTRRRRG
jgi:hypothetical protein